MRAAKKTLLSSWRASSAHWLKRPGNPKSHEARGTIISRSQTLFGNAHSRQTQFAGLLLPRTPNGNRVSKAVAFPSRVWERGAVRTHGCRSAVVMKERVCYFAIQSGPNGTRRVVRGGSYWNNARNCRSAYRDENDPGNRNDNVGFRLAAAQLSVNPTADQAPVAPSHAWARVGIGRVSVGVRSHARTLPADSFFTLNVKRNPYE